MSDQFMETVLIVAGICLFLMMIPIMFRIIVGPTAIDRIVAVNIIGTKTAVLLIIIGALFDNVSMHRCHKPNLLVRANMRTKIKQPCLRQSRRLDI